MSNLEKSFFEHRGIPLGMAPNPARPQPVAVPWLEIFSTNAAGSMDQNNVRPNIFQMPQYFAGNENDFADTSNTTDDRSFRSANASNEGMSSIHSIPEQIKTSELFSHTGSKRMPPVQSIGLSGRSSGINAESSTEIPDAQPVVPNFSQTHGQQRLESNEEVIAMRPSVPQQKVTTVRESVPQIVARKAIESISKSTMRSLPEFRKMQQDRQAGHPPGRMFTQSLAAEDASMHPSFRGNKNLPVVNFSTTAHEENQRVPFGQTELVQMDGPVGIPQPSSFAQAAGQADILQRLNQQSSREQTQKSPKRIHIGHVHITVQRPGGTSAPQPIPNPIAMPASQATPPAQVFINPWDRLYTVFD